MRYISVLILLSVFCCGCQSAYYKTMETFGKHKRDILVDRVEDGREAQDAAKEQFVSALDAFSNVVSVPGSELKTTYETLKKEYDKSVSKASKVKSRIEAIEDVAHALFKEWRDELAQYADQRYRELSEQQLEQTMERYEVLIAAMKKAESKIAPVLNAFHDQVLFLKHNLNAQAVAALQGELASIESEVDVLIQEMKVSIAEADAFIKTMRGEL